jgi:hypothetical protein
LVERIRHTPGIAIADEHLPDELAKELSAAGVRIVSPVHDVRALMNQARVMHDLGECVSACSLVPKYAREPEAVRIWRNRR